MVPGFRTAPTEAAEPGNFPEAHVAATGASLACLAEGALPEGEGAAESHGLLGMVPLKPGGDFLMAGLPAAVFAKGEDFFRRRFLGEGCLPPPEEPGGATFLGTAAAATAALASARLSSLTAAKDRAPLSEAGVQGTAHSMCTRNKQS